MLLPLSGAAASASLSIDDFSLKAGEEKAMVISLSNPQDEITLVQFDLRLPKGLTIKKVDGDYDIDIAGRTTWKKHSLDANAQSDGSIRFLLASSSNTVLSGASGAIITVTLVADGSFSGGDIMLENILMVTPDEKEIEQTNYNYALSGATPPPASGTAKLSIESFTIAKGGEAEMLIDVVNPDNEVTLVQFDLKLPAGLSVKRTDGEYDIDIAGRTTWKKHSLDANALTDGSIRFLLASSSNAVLSGTSGAAVKVTLTASSSFGGGTVTLSNILIVSPDEAESTPAAYSYTVPAPTEPITVTAKNYSREYGDANPTFEYTATGGTLSGKPEISCEATAKSPVGTYPIVIKQGSVTNGDVTYVNGTLTITKAPLTVSGGTYTMKQGEQLPTFKATYSGWKNGDTEAALTKKPTLTTTATSASPVGDYAVTVSGAEAQNYDIKYVNGTLTVTKPDPKPGTAKLSIESFTIAKGGEAEMLIDVVNPDNEVTLVQFDLKLPAGLSIKKTDSDYDIDIAGRTTWKKHSLDANALTDGSIRFLLASSSNAVLSGTSGAAVKVTLTASSSFGGGTVTLSNILIVSPDEAESTPAAYSYTVPAPTEPITVTAKNYSREYGDANPTFEYTATGGTLSGKPEISCEATAKSPVGTYPIVIKQGSVTNGDVTYVNGTLTITKAPLTVSGGTYTMKQGEQLPTFKATYSGWKNGDTEAALTKKPTLTTTATSASPVGDYAVTVSGAEAQNYDIKYVNGTLTVTKPDPKPGTAKLSIESFTIAKGGEAEMLIDVVNPDNEVTLVQFDLKLPAGLSVKRTDGEYDIDIAGRTTWKKHSLDANALTDGSIRFLLASSSNAVLSGTSGAAVKVTLTASSSFGGGTVTLSNILIVSPDEAESTPAAYSYTVPAPTEPITVTAKNYSREYGDANPTFEYTATGGTLSGKPEISCEATAKSPVGTYPIVIKQGSVTNGDVTYVNGTLTITKAPLTVSGGTYTMKQGEQLPTFKATYSGWKNGDTEAALTKKPTLTTTANSASPVGDYAVTVSGAEAQNYDIKYVNGKLTVKQADPVTVTAKSYTREYGLANPMFGYTTTGATLKGRPEITCSATKTSPVGDYPIIIKKGGVTNYNDTYVNGTLTITKAPLKAKALDVIVEQGKPIPQLTIDYEGWRNDETEAVLQVKPLASTKATILSSVGEYPIIVVGGYAKNYEIIPIDGTLTIVPPDVGIDDVTTANRPYDVYTITGRKVRHQVTTLKGLPSGVYIVNGMKVVVM